MIALPETAASQADLWANDLREIEGISNLQINPLHVTSARPAYEVVLNYIRPNQQRFEIKPDQGKLKEAIGTHLETLELHGIELQEVQSTDGRVMLDIKVPEEVEVSGLVTLKQFIGQVTQPGASGSSEDLRSKYAEIKTKLETMGAGPERDKLESYLQQLETKLEALPHQEH